MKAATSRTAVASRAAMALGDQVTFISPVLVAGSLTVSVTGSLRSRSRLTGGRGDRFLDGRGARPHDGRGDRPLGGLGPLFELFGHPVGVGLAGQHLGGRLLTLRAHGLGPEAATDATGAAGGRGLPLRTADARSRAVVCGVQQRTWSSPEVIVITWETVISSTPVQGTKTFLSGLRTSTPSSVMMIAGRRQEMKTSMVSTPSTTAATIEAGPL